MANPAHSTINIKIKVDGKSARDNVGGVSQSFFGLTDELKKNTSSFASFTSALEKTKSFSSLSNTIKKSRTSIISLIKSSGELVFALKNIAAAAQIAFLPFQNLVTAGADFEAQMDRVAAISGATQENLEHLTDTARYLGSTTKYSASEAAKGMEFLSLAGMGANDTIAAMPGLLSLAAASGEELATVSDIVSDQLSALGMAANETGVLANAMAKAMSTSNTSVGMLGESMKYSSPVFTTAGQSMQTLIAATSMLANIGIKGSSSGTALRMSMLRLAAPPKIAATELRKLGIAVSDSQGRFRDFSDILKDFAVKTADLTAADKLGSIKKIVGVEAASAFLELIKQSQVLTDEMGNKLPTALEKFRTQITRSNEGVGAAAVMAKKMSDNLAGDWKTLLSGLEGFYITIYYGVVDILRKIVQSSTGFIRKLTITFKGIGTGLAPLGNIFKGLKTAFKPIIKSIKPVIDAFYQWIGASKESQGIAYSLGKMLGSTLYYAIKILITPIELIVKGLVLLGNWLGKVSAQFSELTAGMTFAEKLRYAIFSVTLWLRNLSWSKFGVEVFQTFIDGIVVGGRYLYATVENILVGIIGLFSSRNQQNLAKSAGQSFIGSLYEGITGQIKNIYQTIIFENEWLSIKIGNIAIALAFHFQQVRSFIVKIGQAFITSGWPILKVFLGYLIKSIPVIVGLAIGFFNTILRITAALGALSNIGLFLATVFKNFSATTKIFLGFLSLSTLIYTQWEKIQKLAVQINDFWETLGATNQKYIKSIVLGIGLITVALRTSPFIAILSAISFAAYEMGDNFEIIVDKIVGYLKYFKDQFTWLFLEPINITKGLIMAALVATGVVIAIGISKIRKHLRALAFAKECKDNPLMKCMIPSKKESKERWKGFIQQIKEGQRGFQLMGNCQNSADTCFGHINNSYQKALDSNKTYHQQLLSSDQKYLNNYEKNITKQTNVLNKHLNKTEKWYTRWGKNIGNILAAIPGKVTAASKKSMNALKSYASEARWIGTDVPTTQAGKPDLRSKEIIGRADKLAQERNIPKFTIGPEPYRRQTEMYKQLKIVAAQQADAQRTIFQKMTNSMANNYTNLSNHLRRETTQTTKHHTDSWTQTTQASTSRLKSFGKTAGLIFVGLGLALASSAVAASEFNKVNDSLTFGEKVIIKLNQAWLWMSNNLETVAFGALAIIGTGLVSLTAVLGAAAAAVVGFFTFKIGTYLYEQSELVRESAITIVGSIVEMWDKIQAIWESIDFQMLGESVIDSLFDVFDGGIPKITNMLNEKLSGLGDILMAPAKLIGELYNTVVATLTDIMVAFSEGDWVGIGVAVVKGIAKGMLSVVYMLKDILVGGFTVVAEGIKKLIGWLFGSEEVKKEAEKFGKVIPDSVAQGVEQGTPQVQHAMESTISEVSKANEKVKTAAAEIGASIPKTIADSVRQNNVQVQESIAETVSVVATAGENIQAETAKIQNAFNFLGVDSQASIQAELQKTADLAQAVFETTWKNNLEVGIATTQEVEKAFINYAAKAIAANQGIASSQLENIAIALSLESELQNLAAGANQTGQSIQQSMIVATNEMANLKNITERTTNEAFASLGIESQKALQAAADATRKTAEDALNVLGVVSEQTANQAQTAFETIKDAYQNHKASIEDVKNAFTAYATIAIESNQGVISSQLESTAAALSLENELTQLSTSGTQATNLLIEAMATVGTVSQESLQKTAETARQAFETVKQANEQGIISVGDVEKSFLAYAAQAIAANQGVASSQLESVAATLSLESELKELGKVAQQTLLEKTANSAKIAFQTIQQASKQGMASIVDVRNAFLAYAEKAIIANQGVASSQLESVASSLLLENELRKLEVSGSRAGKQIADSTATATAEMEKLKNVSKEAVDEAFKTLGVESQKALQEAANTAQQAFKTIQQASQQGAASLIDVNKAFLAYAEKAITANKGIISSQLVVEATTLGLTDELKTLGQAGQNAGLQISEGIDPAANSIQQLESQLSNTNKSIQQMDDSIGGASASSQAMGDQFNKLNNAISQGFADTSIAASKYYDDLYDSYSTLVNSFYSWLAAIGNARFETEQLLKKQTKSFDNLSDRLEETNYLTEKEADRLESLANSFDLLDEADLSGIRGQIESLRQNTEQLSESIRNTLNNLRDELDRMKGNKEGIELRRYEEQIKELKQQLEEAKTSGSKDAIRDAKEALKLAKELHKEKLNQIEEQQTKNHQRKKKEQQDQPFQKEGAATNKENGGGLSKRVEIEFKSPQGTNASGSFGEQDADSLFRILEESGALTT